MKVYISGPITGFPNGNRTAFEEMADEITARGHQPINPHAIEHDPADLSWEGYMRRDIVALMDCDVIVMLPGWKRSRGARLEHRLASILGIVEIKVGQNG